MASSEQYPTTSPRRGQLAAGALALLLLAPATEALATSQQVRRDAALQGIFGLEVAVDNSCDAPHQLTLDGQLLSSGTFEACTALEATGTSIATGPVVFRSGRSIALGEGFAVLAGSIFRAELDPATYPLVFVEDASPASESAYTAELEVDLDQLAIGDANELGNLAGYSEDGAAQFELVLKRDPALGENRLRGRALQNDGTLPTSGAFAIPPGKHRLRVEWRASDPTLANGSLALYLDGVPQPGLAGLDNDLSRIDLVRWGVVSGIDLTTSGILRQDSFASWSGTGAGAPSLFADGFETGNYCAWSRPLCRKDYLRLMSSQALPSGQAQIVVRARDVSESLLDEGAGPGREIQGFAFRVDAAPAGAAQNLDFELAGVTLGATPIQPHVQAGEDHLVVLVSFDEATDPLALNLDTGRAGPGGGIGDEIGRITFDVASQVTPGTQIQLTLEPLTAALVSGDALLRETGEQLELRVLSANVTVVSSLAEAGGRTVTPRAGEMPGGGAEGRDDEPPAEEADDEVPPALLAFFPGHAAQAVPTNTRLTARFSEPVVAQPGAIRLAGESGDLPGQLRLSSDRLWLTFVPRRPLGPESAYRIHFDNVTDAAGNRMPTLVSGFRTAAAADRGVPSAPGLVPAPASASRTAAISPDDPVLLRFPETVDPSTLGGGSITLRHHPTGEPVAGAIHLDPDGESVFFVPRQPLEPGAGYRLQVTGGVGDLAGNGLGRAVAYPLETSARQRIGGPRLLEARPPDGSLEVSPRAVVVLRFDEPLDESSLAAGIRVLAAGGRVPGNLTLVDGDRTAVFVSARQLPGGTRHLVQLEAAVTDRVGDPLDNPRPIAFVTAEGTLP